MVFVVDDDEAVRDSLQVLLESHGMAVSTFATAEAFAASARPKAGACLVLDQNLAGAAGLDFVDASGAALDLPVILITGQGSTAVRARAQKLGVAAYLEKPVAADDLVAAILLATGAV